MPFGGTAEELAALIPSLDALALGPADEVLIVDNTLEGVAPGGLPARFELVVASGQPSSYFARNVGADVAANEWLLFLDADCRPPAQLLDRYFDGPSEDGCGVIAGGVTGLSGQRGLIPRWARSRGHVGEEFHMSGAPLPAGITANLLVRRAAWENVGGFHEGVRSGADIEFCWRLQRAGWTFEHRPAARLEHVHVESMGELLRKARRYGGGQTWVNRRFPGWSPPVSLARELVRAVVGAVVFTLTGRLDRARFKLIDAAWYSALRWGRSSTDNFAPGPATPGEGPALVETSYPEPGAPAAPAVEALARPVRPDPTVRRLSATRYSEDDPPSRRLVAGLGLALRRPARAASHARVHGLRSLAAEAPAARRIEARAAGIEAGPGLEAEQRFDALKGLTGD